VPAVVARADLAIVAQRQSGETLRFETVDPQAARDAASAQRVYLAEGGPTR
jgi:allophanate hydrolase subunit 2